MTFEELNRLDNLLHRTPMKELRRLANDVHKECKRSVLVVMIMDLEFDDTRDTKQLSPSNHNAGPPR